MNRVIAPKIHFHIRVFDVKKGVPIGDLTETEPSDIQPTVEVDVPEVERVAFDGWLQSLWREKDASFDRYYATGSLAKAGEKGAIDLPVELRRTKDILDAFCLGIPAGFVYVWRKWGV